MLFYHFQDIAKAKKSLDGEVSLRAFTWRLFFSPLGLVPQRQIYGSLQSFSFPCLDTRAKLNNLYRSP
jgi:hypothetical protein